ncbi:MAG: YjgN family protein [Brevinematales bacterium]|nr:YjgN family protein [Brevinematales bacterium]
MKSVAFTGKGGDIFGIFLLNFVLSMVSFGIYAPWAKVRYLKYMAGHVEFDGEPFEFHGKGGELFWGIVKVFFLIIILLVLLFLASYLATTSLVYAKMLIVFSVGFVLLLVLLVPIFVHGALRYTFARLSWKGIRMTYTGKKKELFFLYLKGLFLTMITLGIYSAWFSVGVLKYIYDHIGIGNVTLGFDGNGSELFGEIVLGVVFSLLTLGIYTPWWYVRLARFYVSHTYLEQEGKRAYFSLELSGGKVLFFWITRTLLLVVTLGIALPWVIAGWMQLRVNALSLDGDIDTQSLVQHPEEKGGEVEFSLFDLGEGLLGWVFPL